MLLLLLAGCYAHRGRVPTTLPATLPGLSPPSYFEPVQAVVVPPLGWRIEPLKQTPHHAHQVWLSPTGRTAYGVIHAHLPLPLGPDLTLLGFMREMRQTEGDAVLDSRQRDAGLPGIRFIAEGGKYRIYANLTTSGFGGWVIYAGTLRNQEKAEDEFELAVRAREATVVAR